MNNTPELFGRAVEKAIEFAAQGTGRPQIVTINAWNEWTEGSFIDSEQAWGTRYLEAIATAVARGR